MLSTGLCSVNKLISIPGCPILYFRWICHFKVPNIFNREHACLFIRPRGLKEKCTVGPSPGILSASIEPAGSQRCWVGGLQWLRHGSGSPWILTVCQEKETSEAGSHTPSNPGVCSTFPLNVGVIWTWNEWISSHPSSIGVFWWSAFALSACSPACGMRKASLHMATFYTWS